mgnify:CR=1 FL=1
MNIPITSKALVENEQLFPGKLKFEYIMIDDGSKDNTLNELKAFQNKYPSKVKIIKLAGNVGSLNAILAGLEYGTGDCYVIISADMQDPPNLIPKMYEYWQKGVKLVLANRENREDTYLISIFSKIYHKLIKKFALKNIPDGGFDFVFFDKQLRNQLLNIREKNTNILYLLTWLGYDYVNIPYTRKKREIGKSKWTIQKKIKLFIDSFVSFSFFPIRLISILGILLGTLSIVYALYILYIKLSKGIEVPGWTTFMIVFLFVSSFQMVSLGVLGEYIWRTLDASRNRPNYIVEEVYDIKSTNSKSNKSKPLKLG